MATQQDRVQSMLDARLRLRAELREAVPGPHADQRIYNLMLLADEYAQDVAASSVAGCAGTHEESGRVCAFCKGWLESHDDTPALERATVPEAG